MNHLVKLLIVFLVLLDAAAAESITDSRPRIVVSPIAKVRGEEIRLGDLAAISIQHKEFERLLADLKALKIADAPPPKTKTSIPGASILSAIESLGITRDAIGYSIPVVVEVEREGRLVTNGEVLNEVRAQLSRDANLNVQVREVNWDSAQIVPVGLTSYQIERIGMPSAGKVPLRIMTSVDSIPAARFLATAIVDDWREVPVLNRTLDRGMLISPSDIEVVRLNLFSQPGDVADNVKDVLGRAVKSRINAGETIRRSLIDIPPLIPQGKKIIMLYQQGPLKATATGTAMDDGLRGETIRVKNDASHRIVKAKVISAEEVEISLQ